MKPLNTIRSLRTYVQTVAVALLTFVVGAGAAFAQNTIYVDATNGSNLQNGESAANAVATIQKGLELLDNGGTLIIKGDDYALGGDLAITAASNADNDLASFSMQFQAGSQAFVNILGGKLTFGTTGKVAITSVGGAYAVLASATGASDLALTSSGNVSLDAASTLRLTSGAELLFTGAGRFMDFAPQAGTNVSLEYTGANAATGAYSSGPEARQYTNLGNGNVVINFDAANDTFTYGGAISTTGNVTQTDGNTNYLGNVSSASFTSVAGRVALGGFGLTTTGNVNFSEQTNLGALDVGGNLVKSSGTLRAASVEVDGTTTNTAGDFVVTGDFTSTGAFTKTAGALTVSGNATLTGGGVLVAGTNTITGNLTTAGGLGQTAGTTTVGGDLTVSAGGSMTITDGGVTVSGKTALNGNAITNNGSGALSLQAVDMTGVPASKIILGGAATGSVSAGDVMITVPDAAGDATLEPFVTTVSANNASFTVGKVSFTTDKPTTNATIEFFAINGDDPADAAEMTIGDFDLTSSKNGLFEHKYVVVDLINAGTGTMKVGTIPTMEGDLVNASSGTLESGAITSMTGDVVNIVTGSVKTGVITSMTGNVVNDGTGLLTTSVTTLTGDVANDGGGSMNFTGAVTGDVYNDNPASALTIKGASSATGLFTNTGAGAGKGLTLEADFTLSGTENHDFVGGSVSGTGKIILTNAGDITLEAGSGDLGSVDMKGAGSVFIIDSGAATTVTADKVTVSGAGFTISTPNGSTIEFDVDTVTVESGNVFVQNLAGTGAMLDAGGFTMGVGTSLTATPSATGTATLDFGDFTQTNGSVSLNSAAGAASVMSVSGNFDRSTGTFTAAAGNAGSSVIFDGATAQSFKPGPQLQLHDLTITNTVGKVTVTQSLRANGDVNFVDKSVVDFGATSNLILNGDDQTLTNDGSYLTSASVAGVYFGGVVGGGAPAVVGGAALPGGYTINGTGTFGNIFIAPGVGNTVTYNEAGVSTFTGDLNLVSGGFDINNAAAKFNPAGANARVVRYISNAVGGGNQGISVTAGAFNAAGVSYDLVYEGTTGVASGDVQLTTPEFNAKVNNVTFNATSSVANALLLPDADVTINGNFTVSASSVLETAVTANRSFEVKDTMKVMGSIQDGATGAFNFGISLPTASKGHMLSGTIADGGNNNTISVSVTGAGSSIAGSGASADGNTLAASLAIDATGVSITGMEFISGSTTIGANKAAGLTLSMTDRDGVGPETTGLAAAITVGGANAGSLTLGTNVDVNGLLTVEDNGTVDFATHTMKSYVAGGMLTSDADATFSATTGVFEAAKVAGTLDFNKATIPNLKISSPAALTSNVTIGTRLDVDAALAGAQTITFGDAATLSLKAALTNNVAFAGTTNTVALNNADRAITGDFVQNKAAGTTTVSADDNRLTVNGDYTNTTGTLNITDNVLEVVGDVTITAGALSMTSGKLSINATAGARTLSTNAKSATISNLEIVAGANSVNMPLNSEIVVTNLTLTSGSLNTNANGDVILADNGTIERVGGVNTGSLLDTPTFGSKANLVYSGNATIDSGSEIPTATGVLDNVTVNVLGGSEVNIKSNATVNGTLTLTAGNVDEDGGQLTFAVGSGISRANGSLTDPATFTGAYSVTYTAGNTTGNELGGNPDITVDDGTAAAITVTAGDDLSFNSITLGAADSFDMGANTLTATGDLDFSAGSVTLTNADLVLSGTTAQTLTVPAGRTSVTSVTLNNAAGVSLTGGDIAVTDELDFRNGVFNLNGNDVRLTQDDNGALQPTQGFTRANLVAGAKSHIANGTVSKFIAADENVNAAAARSNVEFPVGTLNPNYRPLNFFFTDMDASITLSVGHVSSSPGGTLNLDVIGVDKYPDFHWTVESDVSLREGQNYEVQARADGYLAENFNIDEVVLINRSAGDPTKNNWRKMADSYDNDFTEDNYPVVRAIDASGSIRNTQQLFTFGLPQDIVYANPIAAQEVTAGGDVVVVADLDDVFTSNSALTFALAGDNPAAVNAAINGDNVLSINGVTATDGAVSLTVNANDGFATVSGSFNVTVNAAPTVVAGIADQNLTLTQDALVIDASGVFAGGTGAKTITAASGDAAIVTVAVAGADVTLTPISVGADVEVIITGTDANGVAVNDTLVVSVTAATSVSGPIADQTISVGGTAFVADLSTAFADGVSPVAYAASVTAGTSATVAVDGSVLTVTAAQAGVSTVEYTATDVNGVSTSDTFDVTVNAAPTATGIADFVIDVIDPAGVFTLGADFSFAGGTGALTVNEPTVDDASVASATWDAGAGTLTIDGLADGVANVTLSATDANGSSASFTTQVTVTAVATAPVWNEGGKLSDLVPLTINADTLYTFTYSASSADGNPVTYEFFGTIPTNATLDESTGVLSWKPESDGDYIIRVQAVNSVDNTLIVKDEAVVTVLPAPVEPSFSAALSNQTVASGTEVTFTYVAGTTDEGVTITGYTLANDFGGAATLDAATGEFSFTQGIENPGDYLIKVTATDSRGLTVTTSATITVEMAIPYGDATGNGVVNATDAVAILRFVVGLPDSDITGDKLYVADVSDNGVVNALDAALILRKLVDDSYVFPAEGGAGKEVAAIASLGWNLTDASTPENMEVTLGLENQVRGVHAITYNVSYDASTVRVNDVVSSLPNGWLVQHNDDGEGSIKIAMVGVTAINEESELITVTFEQLNGAASVNSITATGFINDETVQEMDELELKVIPNEFALSQNYPNPFNPTTNISYQLPAETMVNITIYNMVGQKVATLVNEMKPAGVHVANLDMSSFSSGSYIYRIQAGSFTSTKTMMLIK